jgi:hypothetical protein
MIGEFSLYGVYFPALFALCLFCFGVFWLLRRIFGWLGLYRLVWHPALFDLAFFIVLLYGAFLISAYVVQKNL